jgi:hypothetical protein
MTAGQMPESNEEVLGPSRIEPLTPGRVGIISAGYTQQWAPVAGQLGVKSLQDLPGPPNPVDYGLLPFIGFSNQISRAAGCTSQYHVLGNIKDDAGFTHALNQMIETEMDLIVWWSLAVATARQDAKTRAEIEESMRRGVARRAIFVYPCFSGPPLDSPRVIPVAGIVPQPPHLALCPAPPNHPLIPPKIVTWGDWHEFRMAWKVAGLAGGLPDDSPNMNGHSLATWSIAAWLGLSLNLPAVGRAKLDPDRMLRGVSVPVNVLPEGTRPRLGHFEPRFPEP